MSVWIILVVIGIAVVAAGGVFVLERVVPANRRETHNDVFGFVYAIVGVAYAVVLGLIVVAAWNTLDEATTNTYTESNALVQIAWFGHSLPQPQRGEILGLATEYSEIVINTEWPELANHQSSQQAGNIENQLQALVREQQPTAPAAVARYQEALGAANDLSDARRERIELSAEGIPSLLWAALILGGIVTVGFAFLFGMKSTIAHAVVIFSLTAIFACLLVVVYELNYPFSGIVKVGPEAFQRTLELIGQIKQIP